MLVRNDKKIFESNWDTKLKNDGFSIGKIHQQQEQQQEQQQLQIRNSLRSLQYAFQTLLLDVNTLNWISRP